MFVVRLYEPAVAEDGIPVECEMWINPEQVAAVGSWVDEGQNRYKELTRMLAPGSALVLCTGDTFHVVETPAEVLAAINEAATS